MRLKTLENLLKTFDAERGILQEEVDSMRKEITSTRKKLKEYDSIKKKYADSQDNNALLTQTMDKKDTEIKHLTNILKKLDDDKNSVQLLLQEKV